MQPWWGLFLFLFVVLLIAFLFTIHMIFQEKQLIRSGVLKKPEETTVNDILDLESKGFHIWALKRFRQRPENLKLNLKNAKLALEELVSQQRSLDEV